MAWVILVLAGLLEVAFALSLKASQGFTRLWPSIGFIMAGAASFMLLSQALRTLPIGVAYAVWTGIGAAGTAVVGMFLFGESRDPLKFVSLALLLAGIVGLRLTGEH